MTDKIVILSTCGSAGEAATIARRLLETRLAACVSVTAPVISRYHWQGKVDESEEVMLVIKTRRDLFDALALELKRVHPYEVPEILALPVIAGYAPYLDWLDKELTPREP